MAMPSNYRYERKFLVDQLDERQLEALVRLHPRLFYEPYPPRFINNIYFDTPDMQSYHDNVDGVSKRLKLRVRWYGRLLGSVDKPVLEFKIKQDVVGWKVSFPLLPLAIDATLDQRRLRRLLLSSEVPAEWQERLRDMAPVLMNRYHRRYYISRDQGYRLTIDSRLEFRRVDMLANRFLHRQEDYRSAVLELKYGPGEERSADRVSSFFPFPRTKSSKYVQGIERVFF